MTATKALAKTLAEIAIAYLAASVALDYFLDTYPVLLWLALTFEFLFVSIIIIGTLWEQVEPRTDGRELPPPRRNDSLARLERLCEVAIDQRDQTAGDVLSERVRALVFAAAAIHFNISEATLRSITEDKPAVFQSPIGDPILNDALTTKGSIMRAGETNILNYLVKTVEEWTT